MEISPFVVRILVGQPPMMPNAVPPYKQKRGGRVGEQLLFLLVSLPSPALNHQSASPQGEVWSGRRESPKFCESRMKRKDSRTEERPYVARGQWLLTLIRPLLRKSWELADAGSFKAYYGTNDRAVIADKLTRLCARNASILGALTGIIMSADEIVLFAAGAKGGVGLPVNILIAILVLSVEAILLIRMQLALMTCLAKLYDVPLDPDDPEDVMTILAYAIGGPALVAAGTAGMAVGGRVTARVAKSIVKKEAMTAMTGAAERMGIRLLQMAVIKYAVPVVSIVVGMVANYVTTRKIGRIARKEFRKGRRRRA